MIQPETETVPLKAVFTYPARAVGPKRDWTDEDEIAFDVDFGDGFKPVLVLPNGKMQVGDKLFDASMTM